MKALLVKLASRKLLTTLAAYGLGGYLISKGHVEAGTALVGIAQGTYNVGQGMTDGSPKSLPEILTTEALNR